MQTPGYKTVNNLIALNIKKEKNSIFTIRGPLNPYLAGDT